MRTKRLCIALALTGAMLLVPAALAGPGHDHGEAPSMVDALKTLEGTWVLVDESGNPTDEVVSVFKVTAGGSAVIETMFPGTDHEMVTVYHEDRGELVLTHYCMLGNQPRLRAAASRDDKTIVFECAGGMNMSSENDHHMHHAVLSFLGPDRLKAEWTSHKDGKEDHGKVFDLARVSN